MTEKELKKTLEEMKKHSSAVTKSQKDARSFLRRAGIVDSKGNLTKVYR